MKKIEKIATGTIKRKRTCWLNKHGNTKSKLKWISAINYESVSNDHVFQKDILFYYSITLVDSTYLFPVY